MNMKYFLCDRMIFELRINTRIIRFIDEWPKPFPTARTPMFFEFCVAFVSYFQISVEAENEILRALISKFVTLHECHSRKLTKNDK